MLERWRAYFDRHLGARPAAFKMVLGNPAAQMTVVAEFPEWMDPSYVA